MTNQQPPDSDYNESPLAFTDRIIGILKKPQTQIISLVTLTAMVVGGYAGGRHLVATVIPLRVEEELEKILDRDVSLGEVSSFSFNQVIFENLAIPPTQEDPSFLEIDAVKISVDLLSIILRHSLFVNVIVNDAVGYGQLDTLLLKDKQKPLPDSLKLPPLPIPIETRINLRLNHGKIAVTPNAQTKAVEIKTKGKLKLLYDDDTQPLSYQLENTINNSHIDIEGETLLSNTKSKNQLEIRYLYLPEVAYLIPNLPFEIKEGRLNSNLELMTSSLPKIQETIIRGKISLEDVEGQLNGSKISDNEKVRKIPLLGKSFTANVSLDLEEEFVNIATANFTLGDLGGSVDGDIGIKSGYNLTANLNPVVLSRVLPSLSIKSSVLVDGLLSGNFQVKGEIDNPKIQGKIKVKNSRVDRLDLGEINSQFLADLDKVTVKEIAVKPPKGGKIVTQGIINTNFRENLASGKPVQGSKIPFNFRFTANLPSSQLIDSYNFLSPGVDIGNLSAAGEIKGNLNQPQGRVSFSLVNMNGENLGIFSARGRLVIDKNRVNLLDTELVVNESRIQVGGNGDLKEKTWQVSAVSNNVNLTPLLDQFCQNPSNCENLPINVNLPMNAKDLDISVRGKLGKAEGRQQIAERKGKINFNNIEGQGKVNLVIDDGNLQLDTRLVNSKLFINGDLNQISVNKLFPSLPTTTHIVNSQFEIVGDVVQLIDIGNEERRNLPPSLIITADSQLRIENGLLNTVAKIDEEKTEFFTDVSQLSVNRIFPAFEGEVKSGQINVSAKTRELYQLVKQPFNFNNFATINSLNLTGNFRGGLAGGNFNLTMKVNNNQWQSQINTQNLNLESLNQQLSFLDGNSKISLRDLENINSQINISGNLPLFSQKAVSFPVNVESAVIESGKNTINAQGKFNLVNILTQPDLNNLQLQITANSNLNIIPVNQFFSSLSNNQRISFLPQSANLGGNAKFQGVVTAQNLLTNPLGKNNLNIQGNLTLTNLNFNQLEFESSLTGKVIINPSEKIVLDLRGKEDIIAANFLKKTLSIPSVNLTIPFTPNSLEINKTGNFPFNFQGRREDNQFIASVNSFPLENLQIQPVINYGIDGKIQGNLTTNFTINLTDLTAKGDLKLDNLGIGNIIGKQFTTNFNYQNDIAQLNNGRLKFGDTIYDFQGKINLATQNIDGKVNLQGNVEDIFNTLKITDVATLTGLVKQFQNQDFFAAASSIPPQSVGKEDDSLKTKVNLLSSIDQQIRAIAKQIESGTMPNNLEITGGYQGEILLSGKLTQPEIDVNFEGNQWEWLPQQRFPNIVDGLGLIIQESQTIPIQKIFVNANFNNDNLTVKPFRLNIGNSEILFAGNLSPKSQEGNFKIKDFSLDYITAFFPLPFDVESLIDLEGKLEGNLLNPEIKGKLSLNNTSMDGSIIEDKIDTNFAYKDYQLDIATIDNNNIKLNASLPYHPLVLTDKPAIINLQLNTENIRFLELLTKGQLQLTQGNISTDLTITIASLSQLFNKFNLEQIALGGNINFERARINSIALNTPLNLSGTINLLKEKQAIDVTNLQAKINDTDVNISGILPLIKPLKGNENLLTLNIPNQALQVKNIYSGKVDADITIDGTVLEPRIAGYVSLNNGNFTLFETNLPKAVKDIFLKIANNTLPEAERTTTEPENKQLWQNWFGDTSASNSRFFQPQLNNFTLKLDNTEASQRRLYRFLFGGELTLNGGVFDWQNLRAEGAINVRRGQIYLGGASPLTSLRSISSVGQTTFFLSRTNENIITFRPEESILNPNIDIELQADIADYSRQLPNIQRNEVSDPIIRGGRAENIEVVLRIDGRLAQLFPVLSDDGYGVCRVPSSTPIAENIQLSPSQLSKVSQCINLAVLTNQQGTNLNLLNSSLVSLSSSPSRSQGELINLIVGGQLLNLATQLQQLSGEELFENGLIQFILVPLANNISFGVNEKVSTWGKPLGMKNLRLFPLVEGVYEIKDQSNVTVSYDYIYGEFKVRYQMRF